MLLYKELVEKKVIAKGQFLSEEFWEKVRNINETLRFSGFRCIMTVSTGLQCTVDIYWANSAGIWWLLVEYPDYFSKGTTYFTGFLFNWPTGFTASVQHRTIQIFSADAGGSPTGFSVPVQWDSVEYGGRTHPFSNFR
ncbi:hypothetical protein B0H11DRAFT_1908694 [Mycena galericulata]|nr:hypothetical protein B0H11DRAFT_1908694 [Mycena galericulata]